MLNREQYDKLNPESQAKIREILARLEEEGIPLDQESQSVLNPQPDPRQMSFSAPE